MIGSILAVLLLAGVAWLVAGLEREHERHERDSEARREWRARRSDGRKW